MPHPPAGDVAAAHATPDRRRPPTRPRGTAILWAISAMVVLAGFVLLAVDAGRLMVARQQAQTAADAGALAGCGLIEFEGNAERIKQRAASVAADNLGIGVDDLADDAVTVGVWDAGTGVFTEAPFDSATTNAVRVRLTLDDAVQPVLSHLVGMDAAGIEMEAIAAIEGALTVDHMIASTHDIFLAGAADGTVHFRHELGGYVWDDSAPKNTPVAVDFGARELRGGMELSVEVAGEIHYGGSNSSSHIPDGGASFGTPYTTDPRTLYNPKDIGRAPTGKGYGPPRFEPPPGVSDYIGPFGGTVAVFLSDADPVYETTPEPLSFESADSIDYARITPELGQVFFVGDGSRADGTPQVIVAPEHATRFYLANFDWYHYNDNTGAYQSAGVTIGRKATLVR